MCAFIDYNNGIIKSTHEELLGEIKHNIQVNLKVNPDNFPELINIYNSCFSKIYFYMILMMVILNGVHDSKIANSYCILIINKKTHNKISISYLLMVLMIRQFSMVI